MCGILGSINIPLSKKELDLIKHRGPDDYGLCTLSVCDHSVTLGHRRLSIVDLSTAGHQPMMSECGKYVLIFNGEIYNHEDIRKTLQQKSFQGHSDTETILYALKENGIKATEQFNGIFAFAFLDKINNKLFLARDFFGVKPLYYSYKPNKLLFSSELRPIESKIDTEIDLCNLATLLRLRYIPSPNTLYKNVYKVKPGHYIEIDLEQEYITPKEYSFKIKELQPFKGKYKDAVEQYILHSNAAIKRQLMSDVEIGVMLSGGIDSAFVSAIAQKNIANPIKAFTVGFQGNHAEDEIKDAAETAKILGLEHHIVRIGNQDYHDVFSKCVSIIEEPAATTSIIPFYHLSELAAKKVKVVLTGQGADEPLGGYFRYKEEIIKHILPKTITNLLGHTLNDFPIKNEKIKRALHSLCINGDAARFDEAYAIFDKQQITSLIGNADHRSLQNIEYYYSLYNAQNISHPVERMMKLDTRMNLADDLLNYTDKISMHFALETRVPLLDTSLVEFIESLPTEYKLNLLKGKIIHKKAAESILPKSIINRPKRGFQSPTNNWFRSEIGNIEDLLLQSSSNFNNYFSPQGVKQLILQHKKGYNMEKQLFLLLALYYWFERK